MELSVRTLTRALKMLIIICITTTLMPYTVNLTSIDATGNEQVITSISDEDANTSATLQGIIQTFGEPEPNATINIPVQKFLEFIRPYLLTEAVEKMIQEYDASNPEAKMSLRIPEVLELYSFNFLTEELKPFMEFVAKELKDSDNPNGLRPSPAAIQHVKRALVDKYTSNNKLHIMSIVQLVQASDYLGIPEIYHAGINIIASALTTTINFENFCEIIKSINHYKQDDWNKIISTFQLADSTRKNGCVQLIKEQYPELFSSYQQLFTIPAYKDPIRISEFSPDSKHILTGSAEKIDLWNLPTGKHKYTLEGKDIDSAVFSPDNKHILIAPLVGWIPEIFDAHNGTLKHLLEGHEPDFDIASIAFSHDSNLALTGSHDHTAKIWDVHTGTLTHSLVGHTNSVSSVLFSPDDNHVLTGSADRTAKIWNTRTGELEHTFQGHTSSILSIAFSPDGKHVLTGSGRNDQTAKIWNAHTGVLEHTLEGHIAPIGFVAFSPDGNHVLTKSRDGTAKIWNTLSGNLEHTFPELIYSVAYSPDGKHLITGLKDNTVKIWNAETGALEDIIKGHKNNNDEFDKVEFLAFSPNGKYLLTALSKTATIWRHLIFGDKEGNTSIEQALFIILLYNMQLQSKQLDLTHDNDCTNLIRYILFSFNDDARNYLIEYYNILMPVHFERGESSGSSSQSSFESGKGSQ